MLFKYAGMRKKSIGIFLFFCLVFFVMFKLYGFPIAAVLYAGAICGFFGLLFLSYDYVWFCRKYRSLQQMKQEAELTLEKLPEYGYGLEELYQEIIRILYRQNQESKEETRQRYRELTEYYIIWAHQIKTPIAAMRLILQQEDTDTNRKLDEELKRIDQYVEMVLVVLRLDAESTDYVIKNYDLDDIIRQALRKYATQFIYKKIQLQYEPTGQTVLTDEKWLLFVLEQVLSNALKYTRTGYIQITLEDPKVLCIRDSGIGIAPEDLPRIFEKGYTGYNGRADKRASGIGLYLCYRICKKLGHTIAAESVVGEGTIIWIGLQKRELEVE